MLCRVTFKYEQMMILIQQFLLMWHFYSTSADKNLTWIFFYLDRGCYVEGA